MNLTNHHLGLLTTVLIVGINVSAWGQNGLSLRTMVVKNAQKKERKKPSHCWNIDLIASVLRGIASLLASGY